LNARQCFEIGKLAGEDDSYFLAIQWLKIAWEQLQKFDEAEQKKQGVMSDEILSAWEAVIQEVCTRDYFSPILKYFTLAFFSLQLNNNSRFTYLS
jgi:hypothetical protein